VDAAADLWGSLKDRILAPGVTGARERMSAPGLTEGMDGSNHGMHRPGGPVTALAAERGSVRRGPAEPGPRQAHPPVMPAFGEPEEHARKRVDSYTLWCKLTE